MTARHYHGSGRPVTARHYHVGFGRPGEAAEGQVCVGSYRAARVTLIEQARHELDAAGAADDDPARAALEGLRRDAFGNLDAEAAGWRFWARRQPGRPGKPCIL